MACRNDPEVEVNVETVLIWNTRLPYQNEPRTSPAFSLMGSEWCLRFVYCDQYGDYYVITLHQMGEGKVLEEVKNLVKPFFVKTYMLHITEHDEVMTSVKGRIVQTTRVYLWGSGKPREKIFDTLPWLDNRHEVKFACKFYGPAASTLHLQTETDKGSTLSTEDKGIQASSEVPRNIESLSSDFSHLLEKEILPDVRLECGGRTIQAHRSVLAARSDVFRRMFQNEMLESKTGAVKVQDVDFGVLEKLLKYVYTGKTDDLDEDCIAHLYEAADKYDVNSLKTACTYWIERNLNAENCVKYLVIADSHSDTELKAALISFILENPSVLNSETWIAFSKESSKLAVEVFQAYVASTAQ